MGHRDIKNADNLGYRDTETVDINMCDILRHVWTDRHKIPGHVWTDRHKIPGHVWTDRHKNPGHLGHRDTENADKKNG